MSTGFLITEALSEALRKPYHKGDVDVTVLYLVERKPIGEYRVVLKRNFDTACWVPPAGRRGSHTIYYGDRMVARVVDFFLKKKGIEGLPSTEELKKLAQDRLTKKLSSIATKLGLRAKVTDKVTLTHVLDEKLYWLKANLPKSIWFELMDQVAKAVKSYGRHERQHARETPQDLKVVTKDLKTLVIPFSYFNLFEDARIEHISRQELGDAFEWLDLEDIAPPDNPFNMLLRCIQLEGAPDIEALDNGAPFKADDERTVGVVADSVEGYYRRAVECSQAEQLYPIIAEFLREFKEDLPPPPDESDKGEGKGKKGSGSGEPGEGGDASDGDDGDDDDETNGAEERAGDLSTAAEAAEKGDEFFSEFEADAEVVGGTDAEGKVAESKAKSKVRGENDKAPPKGKGTGHAMGMLESIAPTASGGRAQEDQFLARFAGAIDDKYRARVDNLTQMLMRMFKVSNLPAYNESESRRMSGRHLARGEVKFVHKKTFGGKGKRKYTIVFDCSGSMGINGGKPTREGQVLLLALNNLARRGFLEGSLVLSGYANCQPAWLQYKFPVKDEIILRIHPCHGAEGLQNSLHDNLKHIQGMDDVFVYTDAHITDAPLNREYFASRKVWPVGLYVGSTEAASEMGRHFPQNIIRDTIEEVVETMLTRNRRTVG